MTLTIERAREEATKPGVTNVRFEVGSVYELPFADGSFGVIFAHAVFEHLQEPLAALVEIHRVLVSGGLVVWRSSNWGGFLISSATPQLIAALDYYQSLQTQSGGDVHIGRKFKALLREAGFRHLEFSASYECYRSLESIGEYLAQGMECSLGTATTPSDGQRIQSFATALRDWYRCEDGVFAQCWCEILGRK